ncbi:hypothetical protein DFH94DRAFT_129161 [Russula ochroleuca]|uniref:Uncharacterized protein n=1 Tax=Russula ochroleuca TaxID=152965 RepID=A0A9P5JZX6_9AGAM|nr:hypothetical protein DFH94DRAFT_129161 [Russula ochroleuca]
MYYPSNESVAVKNDNSDGINLLPILPASRRRPGETHIDHYFTRSPLQFSVRLLFSITLHETVGYSFCPRPSYRSQGWTVSVHPEGKRYAHKITEDRISVITEAHVTDPGITELLEGSLAMIRVLAAKEDVHLSETTDLFVEVDEDSRSCSYWFADHAHRTIFWLRPVDTNTVGLPDSYSKRRIQYALEENYWTHVEMFPATASQYSMTALNDLHVILLNARADALTSDIPTFPYTAEECDRFINLLQCSKENVSNPYVTTFVARLWAVVANHRFSTHFGEDHYRMSSIHSVVEAPAVKRGLILTAISKALFNLPVEDRGRNERLWVNELVYSSAWRKFISGVLQQTIWVSKTLR